MQKTAITETGRHGAIYAKQARKRCSRAQASVEAHDLVGSDLVSKRTRPRSSGLADPTGDDCSGLDLALITELEPFSERAAIWRVVATACSGYLMVIRAVKCFMFPSCMQVSFAGMDFEKQN